MLIFLGLAIYSNRLWAELHSDPPPDALQVNVSAFQFGWDFRYPGADGKLGAVEVAKISNENKFGVEESDEAGKDDFTSTELVIPFGRPVNIVLNSRDVIHSFYVPFFRLYQDAVPGRTISWVWFRVERPGNFELACSQLCGTGHYNMKAPIRVVSQDEYRQMVRRKSPGGSDRPCSGSRLSTRCCQMKSDRKFRRARKRRAGFSSRRTFLN